MFKTNPQLEELILSAISLLVAIGALAVLGWALVTGQVREQGLDALFLIAVCLLIAFTFGAIPLRTLRKVGLKGLLKRSRPEEPKTAAVERPSSNAETSA